LKCVIGAPANLIVGEVVGIELIECCAKILNGGDFPLWQHNVEGGWMREV
jgi:hypothetical protein